VRAGEGFADTGELAVQAVLEFAVPVLGHSQVINILLDYDMSSQEQRAGACFCTK
jgi:hypothetical protein